MRAYKGFNIEPVYHAGTDFRILRNGAVVPRKQTKVDIAYYDINDPMTGKKHCAEDTVAECRATIDALLTVLDMPDNLPSTWAKLEIQK